MASLPLPPAEILLGIDVSLCFPEVKGYLIDFALSLMKKHPEGKKSCKDRKLAAGLANSTMHRW